MSDALDTFENRHKFIQKFYEGFESLLYKKYFSRMSRRTKVTSQNRPTKWEHGVLRRYTLANGNKKLVFDILVHQWLWTERTLWVEFKFVEGKNLVIPSKKIEPKKYAAIWEYDYSVIYFLQKSYPVHSYIQITELTPLDVGLFDNIQSTMGKILKGKR